MRCTKEEGLALAAVEKIAVSVQYDMHAEHSGMAIMKPEPASTVCVAPEIRSKKVLIAVCIVLVFNELPVALISRILPANRVQNNKTRIVYRPIKCEMRQL
jgi:hypothetical protein